MIDHPKRSEEDQLMTDDIKMAASESDRYTILVVDDEALNIRILSSLLEPEYRVRVANSGERALEVLERHAAPDLILLDIMMPGIDGLEVCRRIKANPRTRSVPIIFVTAITDSGSEEEGLSLGAVDYLTKPIVPAIVRARVATHLALHHQRKDLEKRVAIRTEELLSARLKLIHQLGRAAEFRDNETGMHILRMAHYSRLLAKAIDADPEWCELVFLAAPMHDVGKIGVPDSVLLKPGKLNPEEWEIMQAHAEMGADIIGGSQNTPLFQIAMNIALQHHERWDGTGYPKGLREQEISLEGRIAAIADVFDALVSARPYKNAWSIDEAFAHIKEQSGKHFDPELAQHFLKLRPQIKSIKSEFSD